MACRRRSTSGLAALLVVGWLTPVSAWAQAAPRTAWGQPDLQGVWDFRTITPMERPESLGDQEFLTNEQIADLERDVADRNARLAARPAQRTVVGNSVDRGVFIMRARIQIFLSIQLF